MLKTNRIIQYTIYGEYATILGYFGLGDFAVAFGVCIGNSAIYGCSARLFGICNYADRNNGDSVGFTEKS